MSTDATIIQADATAVPADVAPVPSAVAPVPETTHIWPAVATGTLFAAGTFDASSSPACGCCSPVSAAAPVCTGLPSCCFFTHSILCFCK